MSDPALDTERSRAFENFFVAVQETTDSTDAEQVSNEAIAAWSVVHGVAVLWLGGNLPFPPDSALVKEVFAQLATGFLSIAMKSVEHLR
jgi:Tetracyclin repressor-like, C-terminal domain